MIKKHRIKPGILSRVEILQRRLPEDHPKREKVNSETARYAAGYRGEQALDYPLSFLPPAYPILHDLRLPYRTSYFQMDTLLVTPFFLLIIEVKNLAGTLLFDTDRYQMIRKLRGTEEGFLNPRLQVRRHKHQLEQWLKPHTPPIFTLVVVSFPSTVIKAADSPFTKVIHAAQLPFEIEELKQHDTTPVLTPEDMHQLAQTLVKGCRPKSTDILQEFGLTPRDICKGVQCPSCQKFAMQKGRKGWGCRICSYEDNAVHKQALRDYAGLYGPAISSTRVPGLSPAFLQPSRSAPAALPASFPQPKKERKNL